MLSTFTIVSYILASVFFIIAIRSLSSSKTAAKGNILGAFGMALAVIATLILPEIKNYPEIFAAIIIGGIIGLFSSQKIKMTALPQMVSLFNGSGGLAAVLISLAEVRSGGTNYFSTTIGMILGAVAFLGSVVAYAKLQGILPSKPVKFIMQSSINILLILLLTIGSIMFITGAHSCEIFYIITAAALILGILIVIPIGGADMPVVISVLNSYSGLACAALGFAVNNQMLIITGALVGASGAILSYIMCKAMNRSLINVLTGGINSKKTGKTSSFSEDKTARAGSPDDAAFIMKNASKVIIVPGYGMAVAGAQHILREMADALKKEGVEVKYGIHPVAGRMPGHMNVLLAEANVPYEDVFEMEDINREFATADAVYVIGANDVTNPLAKDDPSTPIYGMPILEIGKAKTIFFIKRSMNAGYSGIDNPLFYAENTMMLFGDAKKVTEEVVSAL